MPGPQAQAHVTDTSVSSMKTVENIQNDEYMNVRLDQGCGWVASTK